MENLPAPEVPNADSVLPTPPPTPPPQQQQNPPQHQPTPPQQPSQPSQDSGFDEVVFTPPKRCLTVAEKTAISLLAEKLDEAARKRREVVEKRREERERQRDAFLSSAAVAAANERKRNDLKEKGSECKKNESEGKKDGKKE